MKYYLLEIHQDYPSDNILRDREDYIDIVQNDVYELCNDERFIDPEIVLARGECIDIEGEGYELLTDDALTKLNYTPSIATTYMFSKESPNLVFDKFKEAFFKDDGFNNIKYHKVNVTPDVNLYRLVIPSIDKEDVFNLEMTQLKGGNTVGDEEYKKIGYNEYQIIVEKENFIFRNPVFKIDNLSRVHAFKLRYDMI